MVSFRCLFPLLLVGWVTATPDDALSPLNTFTFAPSSTKVLSGSDATVCAHGAGTNVPSPAVVTDLALLATKGSGSCWVDGRYNDLNFQIEEGTVTISNGASLPAYRIHPATAKATEGWTASNTEVYVKDKASLVVYELIGSDLIQKSKVTLGSAPGVFKATGILANKLTAPVVLVYDSTGNRFSAWPVVAPTVEGALLTTSAGYSASARRFHVGYSSDLFVPEADWIAGPGAHEANYGIPKKFFAVDRKDGREGVVWQDQTSKSVYMTWFAADLKSFDNKQIYTGSDHLVAATSDRAAEIVLFMVGSVTPVDKASPTSATAMKVSSTTGATSVTKSLDTSETGLNIHAFSSPGASIAWNDRNEIGLCIARTMTASSDGLNHQGAIAVVLVGTTLEVLRNHGQTSGHSFANSLVVASDGSFLGMDLGDNYPRGVNLWKFDKTSRSPDFVVYAFKTNHGTAAQSPAGTSYPEYTEISTGSTTYYKWSNDNNVYTELAHQGVVEVDDGIMVFFAGERPPLDNSKVGAIMNEPRNLGFVKVAKDLTKKTVISQPGIPDATGGYYGFGGTWAPQTNKGINFLTSYTSIDESVSRPKTCRLAAGRNLLLWEIWTKTNYVKTQAMVVDDNGAVSQQLLTSGYPVRLPIADDLRTVGDRAVAYAGTLDGQIIRYEICTGSNCPGAQTTEAPTTEAATTDASGTTVAPTTEAPTTEAATTDASGTTAAPTTEAPTTEAPTTDASGTTAAPTTEVPVTAAPVTAAPVTAAPVTAAAAPTTATAPMMQGDTAITVVTQAGYTVGINVDIDRGTPIYEARMIVGFGSMLLDRPLDFAHGIGATVQPAAVVVDPCAPVTVAPASPCAPVTAAPPSSPCAVAAPAYAKLFNGESTAGKTTQTSVFTLANVGMVSFLLCFVGLAYGLRSMKRSTSTRTYHPVSAQAEAPGDLAVLEGGGQELLLEAPSE